MADNKSTGNLNYALEYARTRGWKVFPLWYVLRDGTCSCRSRKPCKRIGKHPMVDEWQLKATTDEETIRAWWTETPYANIGLATGGLDGLVVMDIDDGPKKVGSQSLDRLLEQHNPLPVTLAVQTGSGGRHYYMLSIHEIKNSKSKVAPDIDIRGAGGYVILPPSNHYSGGKYSWLTDLDTKIAGMPEWLEKLCLAGSGSKIDTSGDTLQKEVSEDARETKLSTNQLIRLLDFIPAECAYDTWWKVGAILKKELPDRGFEAWDAWSQKASDKYDSKVMQVQWDSFVDKGLKVGTLFKFAQELGGFKGFDAETAGAPAFQENWCYVGAIKRFVETNLFLEWDRDQFDAMTRHQFLKGSPSDHILKNPQFRKLNSATYWPEQPLLVTEFGESKLNYWRPSGVTPAPGPVDKFLEHVEYLYPDPEEAKILYQYLAFQVKHPGEKVHWALLLEGDQGNGKSYFGLVMRLVLGAWNVKMVNNDQLHETFTQWQRNTQLIVVEEMMARQRLELMNKLKPMITEEWCTIREMYRPPYEQPNRFNFLFFSNHKDSLILDSTDRRYCILKTKAPPHPEQNRYYAPLFAWTRANGPALLQYLHDEVDLSDFRPKAHAPMTEGKRALISQSMLPLDAFLFDHVEAMEYPCRWDLVTPSSLVKPLGEFNLRPNPKEVANAFQRLGYLRLGDIRTVNAIGKVSDSKINIWAIRNFDQYRNLDAPKIRQLYMLQVTGQSTGDSDADAIYKARPVNPLENSRSM